MDLHVYDEIVRDNIANPGETLDAFDQFSINRAFDPPTFLSQSNIISSLERVLLSTIEEVEIPAKHVGLVMLRSTWARLGLTAPATFADPGFYGTLTMEIFNSNKWGITIQPGTALWTLVLVPAPFEPLYEGRYQGQTAGVTLPKALSVENDMYKYAE